MELTKSNYHNSLDVIKKKWNYFQILLCGNESQMKVF